MYVDAEADTNMAADIAVNAKTQRPGVCNAIENLLIARSELSSSLPAIAEALLGAGVELRCDSEAMAALSKQGLPVKLASEQDWSEEYLDLILSIKTVSDVDEAIQFINRYGSAHSDAIVTPNEERARRFLDQVDSSAVYWNVSTRYTDGGEFGMGAEIGISTDKVGARGPMGLDELASYKWIIVGDGQVRR